MVEEKQESSQYVVTLITILKFSNASNQKNAA